jgi:predicted RNA-binding Zn ribbon-like protein
MVGASRSPALRFDDGGWAQAIGNHVALDLVNTIAWRLDAARTVDRLQDGSALVRWAHFVGLLDDDTAAAFAREEADDPAAGSRATARVRRTREQLYRVVQPLAIGAEPAQEDVIVLHRRLLEVLGRVEVATPMPLEWSAALSSLDDLPDQLGLQVWRLLEREDPARIRQCQDADCGWLFLDRTKNASRVWCSSTDCGNRTRARRHYQRRTPVAGGRPGGGAASR